MYAKNLKKIRQIPLTFIYLHNFFRKLKPRGKGSRAVRSLAGKAVLEGHCKTKGRPMTLKFGVMVGIPFASVEIFFQRSKRVFLGSTGLQTVKICKACGCPTPQLWLLKN